MKRKACAYILFLVMSILTLSGCTPKEKQFLTYTYTENKNVVKNPYQGPYFQFYTTHPEELKDYAKERPDCTMVLVAYNLDDEYNMEQIPEDKKADLENTLKEAEALGLSVILRAAYDFSGEELDPEFSIILSHIEQIAEIVNKHKTCVAGVQAGMIGPFGEWNNSIYMEEKDYRLQVTEKWLQTLDKEIPVSVRRQKFIREAAKAGIDTSRLGIYNDGLFSSESDLGTYAEDYSREEDLQWSKEHIHVPFNGGEMPYVSEYSDIENVVKEADCLQLTYLNREYHWDVWDLWKSQSIDGICGDTYIKQHLGSKIYVKTLNIEKNYNKKKEFEIKIEIGNAGFSMVNPYYQARLIYNHNGKEVVQEAEIAMQSKTEGTISAIVKNPYNKEKTENLTLELQIYRGDSINKDYCIRLANDNMPYTDGKNLLLKNEADAK